MREKKYSIQSKFTNVEETLCPFLKFQLRSSFFKYFFCGPLSFTLLVENNQEEKQHCFEP